MVDAESILIGGVEQREIKLHDYDPQWPVVFDRHRQIIAAALGDLALSIEHIGSTSVPGLAAKPIVDMLLVVPDASDESSYLAHMESAGYQLRVREPDFEQHRMFRTPDRTVHVHVFSPDSSQAHRYLVFRDRLRSNGQDRQRYEDTKRALVAQPWPDMNAYADAKTSIIAAASNVGQAPCA